MKVDEGVINSLWKNSGGVRERRRYLGIQYGISISISLPTIYISHDGHISKKFLIAAPCNSNAYRRLWSQPYENTIRHGSNQLMWVAYRPPRLSIRQGDSKSGNARSRYSPANAILRTYTVSEAPWPAIRRIYGRCAKLSSIPHEHVKPRYRSPGDKMSAYPFDAPSCGVLRSEGWRGRFIGSGMRLAAASTRTGRMERVRLEMEGAVGHLLSVK